MRRDGNRLDLYTHGHPHCWGSVYANGEPKRLQYLCFAAYADDFDALAQRVRGAGAADPHPLSDGQGVWTRDADGTAIQVVVGPKVSPAVKSPRMQAAAPPPGKGAAPGRSAAAPVRPRRLSHVLLFSPDVPRQTAFYERVLGLRLADRSGDLIAFMYGPHASDHHMVAFAKSDGAGPASLELGRRQHRRGRPRRRADARRRATRTAGASAATCSAPTTSTTCRIRGAAGPSTRTTSTSCPADVEWPAADHPAEDSFYVWGPSVPDDFIVNREQPRAA